MVVYWKPSKFWLGQTAFIIGGGPSLTQEMVDSIEGRAAVAVNMSYLNAPWAPALFYADRRWWDRELKERPKNIADWKGIIVTTDNAEHEKLLHMRRIVPVGPATGISTTPDTLSMERTSVQGAMNLAYHLGAKRLVLLGVDNRDADNGRIHHHDEYPWVRHKQSWDIKAKQMSYAAERLKQLGVEVVNCSPVSTITFWPKRPLADVLKEGW